MDLGFLSALHRSDQAWFDSWCERETLEYGIAYLAEQYGGRADAYQYREIVLRESPIERAWEEANAYFESRSRSCLRWVPALSQDTEGMEAFLSDRGFRRKEHRAFRLVSRPEVKSVSEVRVVPARAVRAAYASFCGEQDEFSVDRLDDASLDMFVALAPDSARSDPRVVGRMGLFHVGDIARIRDFSVESTEHQAEVGLALMNSVLQLAGRLAPRVICTTAPIDDRQRLKFIEGLGFHSVGTMVQFEK